MTNLTCRSLVLLAVFILPALLSRDVARSQDIVEPDSVPVDVVQVLELPAHVTNPTLLRSENGYLLKCHISSSSDERILEFTYQVLVKDSAGQSRMVASQTATLRLASYESEDLSLRLPGRLKIRSGDSLVLVVDQVVAQEFVWEVLNARKVLEAYVRDDYLPSIVTKVLNLVDSKPGPAVIY